MKNKLPYITIAALSLACIVQSLNVIDATKRAEMWRGEAVKLSHDWQEIDAKNRDTIKQYHGALEELGEAVKGCLVELKKRQR